MQLVLELIASPNALCASGRHCRSELHQGELRPCRPDELNRTVTVLTIDLVCQLGIESEGDVVLLAPQFHLRNGSLVDINLKMSQTGSPTLFGRGSVYTSTAIRVGASVSDAASAALM